MNVLDPQAQRQFARHIVEQLRSAGYDALWAGGSVRDTLLGFTPKDYDVATSARPEQVRQLFGRRNTVAVGASFGVITVVGPKPAGQVDVATFRQDLEYHDGRRPEGVIFSTAEHDAQRRDFTINGLFYDPLCETVIDYVGGKADLAARVVRAIGNPRLRIEEDKLRMLRAARFAARFDFTLDASTGEAIRAAASQISSVSAERISAELRQMLCGANRVRAVELLAELDLLVRVLPELPLPLNASSSDWPLRKLALQRLQEPTFVVAAATLLAELITIDQATEFGRRLKLSNRDTARITWLIENRGALFAGAQKPWHEIQPLLANAGGAELLQLSEAWKLSESDNAFCRGKLDLPRGELDPPALITGDDLARLGLKPGRAFQGLLQQARNAQLSGDIRSTAEALAWVEKLLPTQ